MNRLHKTVAAMTLGCKVNLYDTEVILEGFAHAGYRVVDFEDKADLYIVNTCTVTNLGDKKSRQMIRRARKQNPDALVIACGCYAQVAPEEVARIEGVNLVVGTKDRARILALCEAYEPEQGVSCFVDDIRGEKTYESTKLVGLKDRTRAFLKIQEGCDRYCTYCIIPYARGPVRSRPPADVLAEAQILAQNGFKEIVLSGIHVASYGKDLADMDLAAMIERVHVIDGIRRIRFSSIEPGLATDSFLGRMKRLPKVCDHFHLSLQSGCTATLRRMNRRYTAAEYAQAVARVRQYYPNAAITTDVIVGFPGETDKEFRESYGFIENTGLSRLHVFPYSPKKGTPAAGFPRQVPGPVKNERAAQMLRLGEALHSAYIAGFCGQPLRVLLEREIETGVWEGHAENYICVRTVSAGGDDLANTIQNVKIRDVFAEYAVGEISEDSAGCE